MIQRLLAVPAAVLLALTAGAQTQAPSSPLEEPPLPRYHVEIILFAHNDANPAEELFQHERLSPDSFDQNLTELAPIAVESIDPSDLGLPRGERDFAPSTELSERLPPAIDPLEDFSSSSEPQTSDPLEIIDPFRTGRAPGPAASGARAFGFRLLRADELQLNDDYARIDRLGAYRALGHAGWVQDGLDAENARPMNLAYLGITNPAGTIRLRVSRFLHLTVDLQYQASQGAVETSSLDPFDRLGELALRQRYPFHAVRNAFRSGDLQYIDHPMFGLLVLITPAPEEEVIEDDTSVLRPAA